MAARSLSPSSCCRVETELNPRNHTRTNSLYWGPEKSRTLKESKLSNSGTCRNELFFFSFSLLWWWHRGQSWWTAWRPSALTARCLSLRVDTAAPGPVSSFLPFFPSIFQSSCFVSFTVACLCNLCFSHSLSLLHSSFQTFLSRFFLTTLHLSSSSFLFPV